MKRLQFLVGEVVILASEVLTAPFCIISMCFRLTWQQVGLCLHVLPYYYSVRHIDGQRGI